MACLDLSSPVWIHPDWICPDLTCPGLTCPNLTFLWGILSKTPGLHHFILVGYLGLLQETRISALMLNFSFLRSLELALRVVVVVWVGQVPIDKKLNKYSCFNQNQLRFYMTMWCDVKSLREAYRES